YHVEFWLRSSTGNSPTWPLRFSRSIRWSAGAWTENAREPGRGYFKRQKTRLALWFAEINEDRSKTGMGSRAAKLALMAATRSGVSASIVVLKANTRRTRKSRTSVARSHARFLPSIPSIAWSLLALFL